MGPGGTPSFLSRIPVVHVALNHHVRRSIRSLALSASFNRR